MRPITCTRSGGTTWHPKSPDEFELIHSTGVKEQGLFHQRPKLMCSCTWADSRFAPSQWEMALLCNDVSHWLGASLESALCIILEPSCTFQVLSGHLQVDQCVLQEGQVLVQSPGTLHMRYCALHHTQVRCHAVHVSILENCWLSKADSCAIAVEGQAKLVQGAHYQDLLKVRNWLIDPLSSE